MADFVRKTAYKVALGDLAKGTFIKREGWDPSYIVGKGGLEISRVNVLAMVVGLDPQGSTSLIIDDGTGKMEVRAFGDTLPFGGIEVGSLVLIIGRPREYNKEIFINPEIVKPLADNKWAEVRKKELAGPSLIEEDVTPITIDPLPKPGTVEEALDDSGTDDTPSTKVYSLIKSLDSGDGADVDKVITQSGVKNAEKIISNLMMEGDIFEVRNGRLKVLE